MSVVFIKYEELKNYSVSDVAEEQPIITDGMYKQIKDDIQKNGQQVPVVIYDNKIYDGRHRFKIAKELKKPLKAIVVFGEEEAERLAVSNNELRRHLSKSQYAMRAALYMVNNKAKLKDTDQIKNNLVSERLVKNAKKLVGNDKLVEEVTNGLKSVGDALTELNKSKDKPKSTPKDEEYKKLISSVGGSDATKEFEEINSQVGLSKAEIARNYVYIKYKLLEELKSHDKSENIEKLIKEIENVLAPIKEDKEKNK